MDIVYVTCAENGLYGLRHLIDKGYSIRGVITVSHDVSAKCMISGYRNVTEVCKARGIELLVLDKYELERKDLWSEGLDVLIVNGWNRLIKNEVIKSFKHGGLGIHAGHPPVGLGRAPLPWNIIKGFKDIEVYVFKLTERADDGDILARRVIEITLFDTVRTLYEKVMFYGARLFEDALQQLTSSDIRPIQQNRKYMVYYQKRTPEDGLIDFKESVEAICNFVRAQTHPYPGAYAFLDGKCWYFWTAIPFDCHSFRDIPRNPGEILAALPSGIIIQTATSPLWLLHATCEGKTVIPTDFNDMELLVGKMFTGTQ